MASDLKRQQDAYAAAKAMMGNSVAEAGDLLDFFKLRAQIEADYAKGLEKLAASAKSPSQASGTESGSSFPSTLQIAFEHLGSTAAALAAEHRKFAASLAPSVQSFQSLKGETTKRYQLLRGRLRQSTDAYGYAKAGLRKAKRSYDQKCQKLELLLLSADGSGGGGGGHTGAAAKQSKFMSAKKGLENLMGSLRDEPMKQVENAVEEEYRKYREAINDLEQKRQALEHEFSAAFGEFEDLELRRSMQSRDNMLEYLQAEIAVKNAGRKLCTEMETCVTAIKVNVDIEQISSRAKEVGWSACRIRPGDYKDLVFGVPLQFHLAFTGRDVPLVVERTAQLVEEHGMFQKGIYRVPGQRTAILRLQAEFEANPNAQLYRPPEAAAWSPTPAGLVESPSQQVVEGGDMLGTSPGPAEAAEGLGSGADYAREAGSRTPSLKSASIQGSATSFLPLNIQDIDPRPVPRGDSSAATTPGSVPPSPAEKSTLTPTGYMDHLGQHRPFQPTDDIKNVAGLLKSFLVELPEPLFSVSPGERLANSRITDHQERLDDVCARLGTIPRCNKATLKFQLEHLHRVAANKQVNSMDEKNLGIVFTPGVFGDQPASQDILLEMKNDTMLAFMIENAPAILSRPPFEQTAS